MNLQKDFALYAKSNGISGMNLHYANKRIESSISNSMTPNIIEERPLNIAQMDVFSRLLMDRIIWLAGPVDDGMSTVVQAQLMFLDSLEKKDITMHIDTPGGSVKSGLGIVDVMDYIRSDKRTINTGMAYSMGSVLLGAGTKGKRNSLRFSKTMIHQSSGAAQGTLADARISFMEWEKVNDILFELLGSYCGKDAKQVKEDATRDLWLTAQESLEYGIIDEIILKRS